MPFNVVDLPGAERAPRSPHAPRVLIYSHDTFGLGHIRRCRAIANSLVASYPHISVIIVSGSSVISSFQFGDGWYGEGESSDGQVWQLWVHTNCAVITN